MTADTNATTTIHKEITIAAPASRVFAALTDPEQLPQWWGADDKYRVERMESDVRVGGKWGSWGTSADGSSFSVEGVYTAVDPPTLIEMTWKHDWEADAEETLVRYELHERDGVTTLKLTHSGFRTDASRDDHSRGWDQVLAWMLDFVARNAR